MIFTAEEKMNLLNRLPSLELSYEPKLHKKVYAPVYYIIPKGPKALIWYTYWHEQNICLLIKLNERGNYSDVQVFPAVFGDALALGTIIYGTYFLQQQRHYFTCEQLYYYKGLYVAKKTYNERLNLLLDMFTAQIEQVAHTTNSLVVGLPVMTETYEEALAQLDTLPYKTYGIGAPRTSVQAPNAFAKPLAVSASHVPASQTHVPASQTHVPYAKPVSASHVPTHAAPNVFLHSQTTKAIFKVKADLAADNYHLYTVEDVFYETAMIPTYKCSVMMNALFRNIKENANLDLLEESDEEDDFENTQIDKFVDLEKTYTMEGVYAKRFKKWQPVKTILKHGKIISLKELQHIFRK